MFHLGVDGMTTRVLLLAGGLGTRLRPLTDRLPKPLIPIAGRPLLDYWLDRFRAAGLEEIRINNHHLPELIREYIEEVNRGGEFRITEAYEPELLGSAGTVTANRDLADGASAVVIVYADNLSDVDLGALIDYHRGHGDALTMMLFRTDYPEKCGIASMDAEGRVLRFEEKPKQPESDLANAGVYVATPGAYREMADIGGFDIGFDVLPRFVGRMRGWVWNGYHRDIGTMVSLEAARDEVRDGFGAGSA